MQKNRIKTNAHRAIKKSFPRFLSLIIMSILGVLVFVGLLSTSPDMLNTLDKDFDEHNVYDLKIISSKGFDNDDLEALKKVVHIKDVEGEYAKDVLIKDKEDEVVINVASLPSNINQITLLEGSLPNSADEIVVEKNFITKTNYKIGDYLELNDSSFKNSKVKIVGTIYSPLYFNNTKVNQRRGTTTIATGTINYYSYTLKDNFNLSYYTTVYLTSQDAKNQTTSSKKYLQKTEVSRNSLEEIKASQEQHRYENIYNAASSEIDKAESEAQATLTDARNKLTSAKTELDNAKSKLDSANKELISNKSKLDNAKKQITNANTQLNNALKQYNLSSSTLNDQLQTINTNLTNINNNLSQLDPSSPEYQALSTNLVTLNQQKVLIESLINQQSLLRRNEQTYQTNLQKYQNAYKEYQKGLADYEAGLATYNTNLTEFNKKEQEANDKIASSRAELANIEKPTWYIYDRTDNQTYSSYIDQTKSIKNLAGLFPIVFYSVAILVSLISMNRMVEEDRGEIGTLKSLGFSNFQIMTKYLNFSFLATIIGSIIGTIIGLTFIPYLIFTIYRLLFDLPNFQLGLNINISLLGILLSVLCICSATIITALKELQEKPSSLIRPKAPRSGKKILLENIKPLWKHLCFSNKITIRNIFRYKKRVAVTIFGVAGCTALMLCGFGIKDSIVDITNMQYGQTFKFDATIYLKEYNEQLLDKIKTNPEIKESYLVNHINSTYESSSVTLFVTQNNHDLKELVNLRDLNDQELNLEETKVIITEKLASLYNIKENDQITILDNDKKAYQFTVSAIAKNYLEHYIYLDENTLKSQNKDFIPNIIYLKTSSLDESGKNKLSKNLMQNQEIINVVHTSTLMDSVKDMLNALNKVVIILILLAAMLAFVVLYNLSNINIHERQREIATLKVLGFYNNEVDSYITKENIILTIIGTALGLFFGYFLTNAVITTVEMENARFIKHISLNSYFYASIISISFTIIVNIVTHFNLKKINMIESLKSVE